MGTLSNTASDIVSRAAGAARHRRRAGLPRPLPRASRRTPDGPASQVARLQSVLDALQVFLPGVFVVVVVWIGARYAVEGQISAGELVAFYGYAAFLMIPLRTATEYANKLIRARVSAQRVCRVLALHHGPPRPRGPGRLAARRQRAARPAHGPATCGAGRWSPWSASGPTSRPRWPSGWA